ncbi:MAG: PepSY domain-containing protein [Colwellia sp.]|jgi:Peptidase propeptide and YPEB domain.
MMLRAILLTLFISFTAFSTIAMAADRQAHAQKKQQTISSQQAAKLVKKRYGGTVLKVRKQKNNRAYRVKIVKPNGQVVSKRVNAKTGKIEKN